jgi:hypothetical protein
MDTLHSHVLPTEQDFEVELERRGELRGTPREMGWEAHTERRGGADGVPTRDLYKRARDDLERIQQQRARADQLRSILTESLPGTGVGLKTMLHVTNVGSHIQVLSSFKLYDMPQVTMGRSNGQHSLIFLILYALILLQLKENHIRHHCFKSSSTMRGFCIRRCIGGCAISLFSMTPDRTRCR